jgi:DNA-binding MarR family transcriptional regulator
MDSFRYFRECTLINLRAHGVTDLNPVHAAMLRRVDEGGTTISDLAQRMGVTKQAAAQLVTRIAALGYVTVKSSSTDSRKKMVRCTKRGKRFLGSLEYVVEDSVKNVAALIGAQRLHELEETLKVIAARGQQGGANGKHRLPGKTAIKPDTKATRSPSPARSSSTTNR